MHKIFLFSIGMAAILTVSTMSFSIQTNMAFPQNSNQNMMMGQAMMKHMNDDGSNDDGKSNYDGCLV